MAVVEDAANGIKYILTEDMQKNIKTIAAVMREHLAPAMNFSRFPDRLKELEMAAAESPSKTPPTDDVEQHIDVDDVRLIVQFVHWTVNNIDYEEEEDEDSDFCCDECYDEEVQDSSV